MSEIAGRAGVSSALAHHYFGAKNELLQATMRHILAELGRDTRMALQAAGSGRCARISGHSGQLLRKAVPARDNRGLACILCRGAEVPELRRLLRVYARRLHSNLMSGLTGMMAHREAERAAEGIAALIDGLYIRRALKDGTPERRKRGRARRGLSRNQTHAEELMNARPNILIIMVDQLNGTLFPDGPADFLHTPHLKALAARSARFTNNYTASSLCAPGRASFMSGQLPSRTRVYDNAAEFASDIPTYAHHLRKAGYYTCLSGKMHFVGPDQLHGFEERLTTDIYPADFGWTPDYRKPGERIDWWYHNLGSVTNAGIAETTNQLEYDDEVAFHAVQKLYQLARTSTDDNRQPWCLTVSFTHPHDPYVARRQYWDLYEDCPALEPVVGFIPYDEQDPHSQRLYLASDYASFDITPEHSPPFAARLFRQYLIRRRQGRRTGFGPAANRDA